MYGGLYVNYGELCQILLSSMRSFLPYVLNRIEDKLMIKYKELNHQLRNDNEPYCNVRRCQCFNK